MTITSMLINPQTAADNSKQIGAFIAVIPAVGTAQTVNPADNQNAAAIANLSPTNWVRANITFVAGITGDATPAQQVHLVPPQGSVQLDFGNLPGSVAGSIGAIDSIVLDTVALPTATGVSEVSALTALAALASATVVLNFASS
jgi:hypothetical protein